MNGKRRGTIPGCKNQLLASGLCRTHWRHRKEHGDPLGGHFNGGPARYIEEVVLKHQGGCLIWPFGRSVHGYARFHGADSDTREAHRYVCRRVHGPPPTPEHEAAHNCGRGQEGCISPSCLEWKTKAGNAADRVLHGTHNRGTRNPWVKLSDDQVREIRRRLPTARQSALAREFNVSPQTICDISKGRVWSWLE